MSSVIFLWNIKGFSLTIICINVIFWWGSVSSVVMNFLISILRFFINAWNISLTLWIFYFLSSVFYICSSWNFLQFYQLSYIHYHKILCLSNVSTTFYEKNTKNVDTAAVQLKKSGFCGIIFKTFSVNGGLFYDRCSVF